MPYVHIQITREQVTTEQKSALIRGTTELLQNVLNKNPATTFVVIEEIDLDNWGIAGQSVSALRGEHIEIQAIQKGST
ncbi:MAG: 4-oxalocrotonate tautomerase family protein [Burkholderiales bacterium]|nr:MAG: 4-oxalocrotonate tautomerase family protein [Burkholderiales bacterium]